MTFGMSPYSGSPIGSWWYTTNRNTHHTTPPASFQTNSQYNKTSTEIVEQQFLVLAEARQCIFWCIAPLCIPHLLQKDSLQTLQTIHILLDTKQHNNTSTKKVKKRLLMSTKGRQRAVWCIGPPDIHQVLFN